MLVTASLLCLKGSSPKQVVKLWVKKLFNEDFKTETAREDKHSTDDWLTKREWGLSRVVSVESKVLNIFLECECVPVTV